MPPQALVPPLWEQLPRVQHGPTSRCPASLPLRDLPAHPPDISGGASRAQPPISHPRTLHSNEGRATLGPNPSSAPAAWALVPGGSHASVPSRPGGSQAEARAPWRLIRCFVWAWERVKESQRCPRPARQPRGGERTSHQRAGAGRARACHRCSRTPRLSCPHCSSLAPTRMLLDPNQPGALCPSPQGPSCTWKALMPQLQAWRKAGPCLPGPTLPQGQPGE